MNPAERYACVCVKEFPAQALLRMRAELRDQACVVMEGNPPLEQVCSLNRKARALGLARGMTKVEVETFPQAAVLTRSVDQEAAVKAVLLECAGGFSPRVEECSEEGVFLCAIDIAGTEMLFGPAEVLAQNLLSQMNALGLTGCAAVSSNFNAARTAAKALTTRDPVQVIPAGEEAAYLASLPVTVIGPTEGQAETFVLWGIRTLGMLANLPEKELIARMGQAGKRLRQLARGEHPHLFLPVEPEFTLAEGMELDTPVELLEALLFVANMMLEQLIARATARVLALASVSIRLKLEGGATHARTVRPALPTNDRQMWIKLLHLDLEAHPPEAAILAVALQAEPGRTSKVQLGLFSPQLPESSRLDVTLARIRAIVGDENVGRAVLKDTHEADGFEMESFTVSPGREPEASSAPVRPAMRRMRPAVNILMAQQNVKPKTFIFQQQRFSVEHAYGPWLSSGEWWKSSLWGCEQWDLVARSEKGEMLCCCVMRDVLRNEWRMMALYD